MEIIIKFRNPQRNFRGGTTYDSWNLMQHPQITWTREDRVQGTGPMKFSWLQYQRPTPKICISYVHAVSRYKTMNGSPSIVARQTWAIPYVDSITFMAWQPFSMRPWRKYCPAFMSLDPQPFPYRFSFLVSLIFSSLLRCMILFERCFSIHPDTLLLRVLQIVFRQGQLKSTDDGCNPTCSQHGGVHNNLRDSDHHSSRKLPHNT